MDGRLLFLNPSVERTPARRMALHSSSDSGDYWPEEFRLVLDAGAGVGAPGLALLPTGEALAVYRSSAGTVVAQVLPLSEIVAKVGTMGDVTGGR